MSSSNQAGNCAKACAAECSSLAYTWSRLNVVRAIAQLTGGKRVPVVVEMRQAFEVPPEVHRYYASAEGKRAFSACALVVSARLGRLLGNMAVAIRSVMGNAEPLQLLEDEASALAWVRQQRG